MDEYKTRSSLHTNVKNLTLSAMFIALGIVLPFLTGQIPEFGSKLLPMHIPIFFCGLICGWQWGLAVGFATPLLRGVMFGMPVFYPTGIAMAFELAAYGSVIGFLYSHVRRKTLPALYGCMITAMISGRIVWGCVEVILLGLGENGFTLSAFISGAFLNAVPGIILQLILIPAVMTALNKSGLIK
ncbi:MAG: ECF transporter S component [Clostridiales bacterium]|nr:ECF transporter S component [Clostridiales bacterium]